MIHSIGSVYAVVARTQLNMLSCDAQSMCVGSVLSDFRDQRERTADGVLYTFIV